jgi:putative transposase
MRKRKSSRLRDYDYSSRGAYFVTICTHRKVKLFGYIQTGSMCMNQAGQIVATWWRILPFRYPQIALDEFIVMPNHLHGILHIRDNQLPVGEIHEFPLRDHCEVETSILAHQTQLDHRTDRRKMLIPLAIGFFKMNTAKAINSFRDSHGTRIWQRSYYERIIRNETELNRIREYILNNPLNLDLDLSP